MLADELRRRRSRLAGGTRSLDQEIGERETARVGHAFGRRTLLTQIELMNLVVDDLGQVNGCRLAAQVALHGRIHCARYECWWRCVRIVDDLDELCKRRASPGGEAARASFKWQGTSNKVTEAATPQQENGEDHANLPRRGATRSAHLALVT